MSKICPRVSQSAYNEMVRVDQAGEFGAVQIYKGQLRTVKDPEARQRIAHMLEQEEEHLAYFNKKMTEMRVRPTLLSPLWHLGGYAMGALTGLLGTEAAMACTAAVEEVIEGHYEEQKTVLGEDAQQGVAEAQELLQAVEKFQADEVAHKEEAYTLGAEQAPAYHLLSLGIRLITRSAIALSKKI